jgi:hypothetical protein
MDNLKYIIFSLLAEKVIHTHPSNIGFTVFNFFNTNTGGYIKGTSLDSMLIRLLFLRRGSDENMKISVDLFNSYRINCHILYFLCRIFIIKVKFYENGLEGIQKYYTQNSFPPFGHFLVDMKWFSG